MKCKVFVLPYHGITDTEIVNDWFAANPTITVTHIAQSQDPATVTISVFYEV